MVNRRSTSTTPERVLQLQRQLEDFRSSQPGRVKLPESLWQAAVELAGQYGIWQVAQPLRLDYMRLKKRLGEVPPSHRRKSIPPAFIEVVAAQPAVREACVIEFESPGGAKMRIHWKATTPPDWTNLLQKLVRAVFFFHPAVWWIENRLSLEREMACDDMVLAQTASASTTARAPRGAAETLS